MFGLPSIQKLIVLAAVVAAVWYGFKFLGRLQKQREEEAKLHARKDARAAKKKSPKETSGGGRGGQVEDLVQCPSCGAYIQAGTKCDCGGKG